MGLYETVDAKIAEAVAAVRTDVADEVTKLRAELADALAKVEELVRSTSRSAPASVAEKASAPAKTTAARSTGR